MLGHFKNLREAHGDVNMDPGEAKCGSCSTTMCAQLVANGESTMGFLNSFWFTLTGFFLQSTSVNPKVILF